MQPVQLEGKLASLEAAGDYVHAAAAEAGLDKKAAYKLHLAVDEVATNTIMHAYEERGIQGRLHLTAEIDPGALRIHLEDTGVPYDPTQKEAPADLDKPLEERGIGGLGIFLAKRNVDAFLYERRGDRNRVTFVLNRPPAAS
jgi:serine/threonine-protein kinase RsbW